MHFYPPLNIEIDPYKNFLGDQQQPQTAASVQQKGSLQNNRNAHTQ